MPRVRSVDAWTIEPGDEIRIDGVWASVEDARKVRGGNGWVMRLAVAPLRPNETIRRSVVEVPASLMLAIRRGKR